MVPSIFSKKAVDLYTNEDFYSLLTTSEYRKWKDGLRDRVALRAISAREARIAAGLFGDTKRIGDKVSELRVDVGPGYRIYFTIRGQKIILLLIGGDKSSQESDIRKAKRMAEMEIEEEQ